MMVVSRWPVSVVVEVSLVSPSPPQCVLCAKKFALRGLVVGVSVKKFALRGLLVATAVESSPCAGKTLQIGPFWASRASFVPHMR